MKFNDIFILVTGLAAVMACGCREFIEVPQPPNAVTRDFVFSTDANATSAMLATYSDLISFRLINYGPVQAGLGAAADELMHITPSNPWASNSLDPTDTYNSTFWTNSYKTIYNANMMIEGVNSSAGISEDTRSLLDGEAKFLRAFSYFYLTSLYGKVPLLLTTDYKLNSVAVRAETEDVYRQVIADLKDAQNQLKAEYPDATNAPTSERVRANKAAATALLARVYLYHKDYAEAETEASRVIAENNRYGLTALSDVFLKNSREAIWQITPSRLSSYTSNIVFLLTGVPSSSRPYWLRDAFIASFEEGDGRRTSWTSFVKPANGTTTYYFPYKFKTPSGAATITEYEMMLRLAEQYLIRAEARISQGGEKIAPGIADLNVLRARAREEAIPGMPDPLPALPANLSAADALRAVEEERRHELFAELGHRWFDLVRTGRATAVVGPLKGANWQQTDQLFPVPQSEIDKNQHLAPQNQGY